MVVRVWNELEKEKMMVKLRKAASKSKERGEVVRCPTLETLPPGWNRINVRKMNGIRAKFYLAPSGLRYQHFEPALDAKLMFMYLEEPCPFAAHYFIFTGTLCWRLPWSRPRMRPNLGWTVSLRTPKKISKMFQRKRKRRRRSLKTPRRNKRKKVEQKEKER